MKKHLQILMTVLLCATICIALYVVPQAVSKYGNKFGWLTAVEQPTVPQSEYLTGIERRLAAVEEILIETRRSQAAQQLTTGQQTWAFINPLKDETSKEAVGVLKRIEEKLASLEYDNDPPSTLANFYPNAMSAFETYSRDLKEKYPEITETEIEDGRRASMSSASSYKKVDQWRHKMYWKYGKKE